MPPPPQHTKPRDQVATWHASYAREILPLKQALGAYQQATSGGGDLATACRQLRDATIELAKLNEVTAAPVGRKELRAAIGSFRDAGMACLKGQSTQQRIAMQAGTEALGRFAGALKPYGLVP